MVGISLWLCKFREIFSYIQERHIPYPSLSFGGQNFSPHSSLEVPGLFKDVIFNLGKIQILLLPQTLKSASPLVRSPSQVWFLTSLVFFWPLEISCTLLQAQLVIWKRICWILSSITNCDKIGSYQDIYSALLLEMKMLPVLFVWLIYLYWTDTGSLSCWAWRGICW